MLAGMKLKYTPLIAQKNCSFEETFYYKEKSVKVSYYLKVKLSYGRVYSCKMFEFYCPLVITSKN
jgi:hypothetical protein